MATESSMTGDLVPAAQTSDSRIDDLTAQFLATRKSDHTRDAYRRDLASWWDWCRSAGLHPLDAYPGDVLAWLATLAAGDPETGRRSESGTTQARRLGAVSSWYGWLIKHQATGRNPAAVSKEDRPTRAARRTPALSTSQAEKLLAAADADSLRAAAIVYLLIYTGIRVGELIAANRSDIGMTEGEMVLHVHGKGGKTRVVRLNTYVLARLDRYEQSRSDRANLPVTAGQAGAGSDRPLIATNRGNRIDRKEVRRLLRRLADQAGLPEAIADSMTPHMTRATYATSSFANKLDGRAVQATMGHASFDTTAGYDRSQVTAARDPAIRLVEFIRPPTDTERGTDPL